MIELILKWGDYGGRSSHNSPYERDAWGIKVKEEVHDDRTEMGVRCFKTGDCLSRITSGFSKL